MVQAMATEIMVMIMEMNYIMNRRLIRKKQNCTIKFKWSKKIFER